MNHSIRESIVKTINDAKVKMKSNDNPASDIPLTKKQQIRKSLKHLKECRKTITDKRIRLKIREIRTAYNNLNEIIIGSEFILMKGILTMFDGKLVRIENQRELMKNVSKFFENKDMFLHHLSVGEIIHFQNDKNAIDSINNIIMNGIELKKPFELSKLDDAPMNIKVNSISRFSVVLRGLKPIEVENLIKSGNIIWPDFTIESDVKSI